MGIGGGLGADGTILIDAILRDKASAALRGIGSKTVGLGDKMMNLGSRIRSVGQSMTIGLTVPLVGFGAAASSAFMGFDDAMARVAGLTNTSQEQMAEWREEILAMAPDLATMPKELADALFFVASAGLEAGEIIPTMEAIGMASAAGLGETADLAILASGAINAFRAEGLTGAEALGILTAAAREGNAEIDQMSSVMGRVMPFASELDISFRETSGAMAALTLTGADAGDAATFLGGVFRTFVKASPQLDDALEEIGLSFEGVRESIREKGLLATLQDLGERIGDNDRLMGQIFPRLRGLGGVFTLLGDNAEGAERAMINVGKASEQDLLDAFEATETEGREFRRALVELNIVLIRLGSVVLPIIVDMMTPLVAKISSAVAWFQNLPGPVQKGIVIFAGLLAVLGPVLIAVGALVAAGGFFVAAWGAVMTAVAMAVPVFAVLLGPVGLVILALVALGVIAYLVWKHWDSITEAVGNAIDALMGLPVVGPVIEHIVGVIMRIKEVAEDIISFFVNVFTGDWDAAWQDIKDIAMGLLTLFLDWLTFGFGPEVLSFFGELPGKILDAIGDLGELLLQAGLDLLQGLLDGIQDHWQTILLVWFFGLPGLVLGVLYEAGILSTLFSAGTDLLRGLKNGILTFWNDTLKPFIQDIPGYILTAIVFYGSLALLLYGKGWDIAQGLWQGIADAGGQIITWATHLGQQIVDLVGDVGGFLYQKGKDLIQGLIDGILDMVPSIPNPLDLVPGGGAIETIGGWIKGGIGHKGGVVPGRFGQNVPMILQAGELIIPRNLVDAFRRPRLLGSGASDMRLARTIQLLTNGVRQVVMELRRNALLAMKGIMVLEHVAAGMTQGAGSRTAPVMINFNGPVTRESVPEIEQVVRRVLREHARRN